MRKVFALMLVFVLSIPESARTQDSTDTAKAKSATSSPKSAPKKKSQPNPTLAKIEDKPGLPRVLLIGDSISIGYTLSVRAMLADEANVHRIPTNGGPTTNGLKNLDTWIGDSKWDVIHFNWGLHDLKYQVCRGRRHHAR